VLALVKDIESL